MPELISLTWVTALQVKSAIGASIGSRNPSAEQRRSTPSQWQILGYTSRQTSAKGANDLHYFPVFGAQE
jgi:hypothetical protein